MPSVNSINVAMEIQEPPREKNVKADMCLLKKLALLKRQNFFSSFML